MADETGISWRTVPHCPDYEVTGTGRVRRLTPGHGARVGRELRTPIDSEGYPTVHICGRPRRVHVLVADAFLGPLERGALVHHCNEDRGDPSLPNLEVVPAPRAHGERHRKRSDLRCYGENNPRVSCACKCGSTFRKYDRSGRPRRFVSGHNLRLLREGVMGSRG